MVEMNTDPNMLISESPNHKFKTLDTNFSDQSSRSLWHVSRRHTQIILQFQEEEKQIHEAIHIVVLHIVASLVPMTMLGWILYTGFQLATKRKGEEYDRYAFSIAIFTFVLGLIYVAVGLTIIAELVLNLTDRLQLLEDTKEKKTIHKDRVRYTITSITIFLLLLLATAYAGFKLATELTIEEGKCNHLGFLVGIISITFGLTYLIIGTAIVVDLIRNLRLKMNYKKIQKEKPIIDLYC